MADRGRVRDSEDSRWLVGLFLVKQREANSGPQIRRVSGDPVRMESTFS